MHPALDVTVCRKDGLCTRACPVGRLARDDTGSPVGRSDVRCIECGHCASVCPAGALSLGDAAFEALADGWRLDYERVAQLLKGRRSIRAFKAEPVADAVLLAIIRAAQYAPSGHNAQPLAWTVIRTAGEVRAIAEATVIWMRKSIAEGSPLVQALDMQSLVRNWDMGRDAICRDAPHLVIAQAPAALSSASLFAAIAGTYLDLAAQPLGVGTCWAGFVMIGAAMSAEVQAALRLPEGRSAAGVLMVGRPALTYRRIPARRAPQIEWR